MNIGVYVSSQYGDYYEFSQLLSKQIRKYTQNPVLLGVISNNKDTGYELLRRYAEEHRIHLKAYTAEWRRADDRRFRSKKNGKSLGGVIAIYHCVHNSERTIAFNSGGKGTATFIKMSNRLHRPCDVIAVNPFKKVYNPRFNHQFTEPKADTKDSKYYIDPTQKPTNNIQKTVPDSLKIQRNIPAKTPLQNGQQQPNISNIQNQKQSEIPNNTQTPKVSVGTQLPKTNPTQTIPNATSTTQPTSSQIQQTLTNPSSKTTNQIQKNYKINRQIPSEKETTAQK